MDFAVDAFWLGLDVDWRAPMKRALVVCLTILLPFAFALTGHALSIAVDTLEFSSLEEFLEAYKAVCEGTATGELAELAGNDRGQYSIKFAELDELYLPTGVPEDYKLHKIGINYLRVFYIYLHKNDLISEEAIQRAILEQKEFHFSVFRWKLDYPMEGTLRQSGATEKNLIGGVYLFEKPNSLTWG